MVVFALLVLVLSVLRVNGVSYQFRPYWELGNVEMFEPLGFIYTDIDETYRLYLRAHPTPFGLITVSSTDLVQWSEPELVGVNGPMRPNMMPVASFLAAPGDYEAHHLFVDNDTFIIAKDEPLCQGWNLNITLEIPMDHPIDWKFTSYLQIEQKPLEDHEPGELERMDLVVHYDPATNLCLGWRLNYANGEFTTMYKVLIFLPDYNNEFRHHFDYENGGQATFARFVPHAVHRTAAPADIVVFHITGNATHDAPRQNGFHYTGAFHWAGPMSDYKGYEEYSDFYGLQLDGSNRMRTTWDGEKYKGLTTGRSSMDGLGQDLTPPAMLWNPPTEEHVGLSVSSDAIPLQPTNSIGFWYRQRMQHSEVGNGTDLGPVCLRYFAGLWTDFYRKLGCAYHAEKSFGPGNSHNYLHSEAVPPHMMMIKSKALPIQYITGYMPKLGKPCLDCPEQFLPRMPWFGNRCVDCPEEKLPSLSLGGPGPNAFDNVGCDEHIIENKVYLWDLHATGYSAIDTEWERLVQTTRVSCGYLQSSQYDDVSTNFDFVHEFNHGESFARYGESFARYIEFFVLPPYDPKGEPQTCGPLPDAWPECTESSDGTC